MKTSNIIIAAAIALFTSFTANANANSAVKPNNSDAELLIEITHVDKVEAHDTDTYSQVFYAGESVYIYVSGDGDTDLDLYIYDENGNLIDSDTDSSDDCLCTFTPCWKGKFTIRIKNRGNVYNKYTMAIVQ